MMVSKFGIAFSRFSGSMLNFRGVYFGNFHGKFIEWTETAHKAWKSRKKKTEALLQKVSSGSCNSESSLVAAKQIALATFYLNHVLMLCGSPIHPPQCWQRRKDAQTKNESKLLARGSENTLIELHALLLANCFQTCVYYIGLHTVDARNTAPVDTVNIPLFTGLYTCQVVSQVFLPSTVGIPECKKPW